MILPSRKLGPYSRGTRLQLLLEKIIRQQDYTDKTEDATDWLKFSDINTPRSGFAPEAPARAALKLTVPAWEKNAFSGCIEAKSNLPQ